MDFYSDSEGSSDRIEDILANGARRAIGGFLGEFTKGLLGSIGRKKRKSNRAPNHQFSFAPNRWESHYQAPRHKPFTVNGQFAIAAPPLVEERRRENQRIKVLEIKLEQNSRASKPSPN